MVAQVPVSWQLFDMLLAMGIGIILAIFYDLLRLFLPSLKSIIFICDVTIFAVAAVWVFSFAVSLSKTGVFRWYMAIAAGVGYLGYLKVISPLTRKIRKIIHFVVMLPFRLFKHYILGYAVKNIVKKLKIKANKTKKLSRKSKKCLKNPAKVLYNSN